LRDALLVYKFLGKLIEINLMVGKAVENRRHGGVEVIPQNGASGLLKLELA
jgi:hypothetical protein